MNSFEETLKAIRKAKSKAKNPREAMTMLKKAGILDASGRLAEQYRISDREETMDRVKLAITSVCGDCGALHYSTIMKGEKIPESECNLCSTRLAVAAVATVKTIPRR